MTQQEPISQFQEVANNPTSWSPDHVTIGGQTMQLHTGDNIIKK